MSERTNPPVSQQTIKESEKRQHVIQRVNSQEKLDQLLINNKLFDLYQEAFGDPPYSELFTPEKVRGIFEEYVMNGLLLVARTPNEIIGFAAAIPARVFSEVDELFGETSSFNPDKTWYIADVGVSKSRRHEGIGRQLTTLLCENLQPFANTAILRTSVNNTDALSMYYKLGFTNIPGITQEVENQRVDGTLQKDTRIFLIKSL